jgi:hypothetical protein
MHEEPKHLKRGLKDLSPLFQANPQKQNAPLSVTPAPAPTPTTVLQSLNVLCPEAPQQSLFLNACMASKMQTLGYDSALISVRDKSHAEKPVTTPVRRFELSPAQFEEICHSKIRSSESFGSSVFFFDFDYQNPIHVKKVLPILDKWILLIKPEQESISEGYKFIKTSLAMNPGLEYFMMINGMAGNASTMLYERFSEMVSRRLGVALNWLGHFDLRFPSVTNGISLESLQAASSADSLEKRAFAGFIYPSSRAV